MKTLVFLANGFETMEFSVFIDVLGWARNDLKCDVGVDTCGFHKEVVSTFHVPVIVDKIMDEICVDEYDAIAIPGGFQEFDFYKEAFDEKLLKLVREFYEKDKIIATVCVAALILGKSGILVGKNATTYHLDDGISQGKLKESGAVVINEPIVVDGKIITSYCPQTAPEVAFVLLEMLTSKKISNTIKKSMGF